MFLEVNRGPFFRCLSPKFHEHTLAFVNNLLNFVNLHFHVWYQISVFGSLQFHIRTVSTSAPGNAGNAVHTWAVRRFHIEVLQIPCIFLKSIVRPSEFGLISWNISLEWMRGLMTTERRCLHFFIGLFEILIHLIGFFGIGNARWSRKIDVEEVWIHETASTG